MADTMQFDLVSPEKSLASAQVTEVQIPGAEGDLTAMPNHAPLITTLRPGVLKASGPDGAMEYVVTGGFAEISAAGTSVLAERAYAVTDLTQDILAGLLDEGKAALEAAPAEANDALAKQVADIQAMGSKVGLSV